jgi:hypothetical protein
MNRHTSTSSDVATSRISMLLGNDKRIDKNEKGEKLRSCEFGESFTCLLAARGCFGFSALRDGEG